MNYDIVITALNGPRVKNMVAHHIASSSGSSLQEALNQLEHLPFVYKRNCTRIQTTDALAKLKQLGAVTQVVQNTDDGEREHPRAETPPPPDTPRQPARPVNRPKYGTAAPSIQRRPAPAIDSPEPKPARRGAVVTVVAILAIVIVAVILLGNRNRLALEHPGMLSVKPSESGSRRNSDRHGTNRQPDTKKALKPKVSPEQKKQSEAYADSAAATPDPNRAVKFFLLALSINKYNVAAWYGLIGAYADAGMAREEAQARHQMEMLFGANALSVVEIVKTAGTVRDVSTSEDGTVRIEYTSTLAEKDDLLDETYQLARELRTVCGCSALSFNVAGTGTTTVLVHLSTGNFPESLSDFLASADITILE